ncbi:hypothetical protein KAZ01_03305, partial [Candidatus Gracilibacteria bacterium]|nr:hypothetical protein [Candidatus Gracilibacteria bacterium]
MININLIGNSDKNNIEEGLRRKEKGIFSKINSSKFSNIISGIIGIGMGIGVFSGCSEDKKEPSKIKKPVKVENTFISMPNEKGIEFDKIIFDKIKQGREILNQKKAGFELENYKEKKIIKKRLKTYNSLLVVYNLKSKEIKTILFEGFKHDVDNQNKSKDGFKVFFEKSNGANTDFKVEIPEGWVTIGLKRVLPFG